VASLASKIDARCIVVVPGGDGDALPGLADELAAERREALAQALLKRALDWAGEIVGTDVRVVEPAGIEAAAQGASAVILVRPALVRLGSGHAEDLLTDLTAGCGLVIGPTLAGGWYLLGVKPADFKLIAAAGDGGAGSAGSLIAYARSGSQIEVGLLRAERDLTSTADLLAARADPLLDIELTGLLG